MHAFRFKLGSATIAGINDGGRLRRQVAFDGTLIDGALRTRTELSRFTIVLHAPSQDGATPPDCIRVETVFSDEAFIDVTFDETLIERLMYARADDDIALLVCFRPGGALDDQGHPVFEVAGHPDAIDWYTNRAVSVPIAVSSVTMRSWTGS